MSLSSSIHAYPAEVEAFERAMGAQLGIMIKFATITKARAFLARLHNVRRLQRQQNAKILPVDHPLHGQSDWDALTCCLRQYNEHVVVQITRINQNLGEIIEITDDMDVEKPAEQLPAPMKQLVYRRF